MITRILIALNVLGFLWELRVGGMGVFNGNIPDNSQIYSGMLVPIYVSQAHEYYRIVTCAFLHGSIIHIAVNMFSLYVLGRFIEAVMGGGRTLFVYVIAMVVSGFSVVYFSTPDVPTLGASGAIFGLFGALFAIGLKLGSRGMQLVRSNIGILLFNLVFSFAVPGISWQAHVGGLISGFVATYLVYFPPKPVFAHVHDPASGAEYESELETPDDRY